MTERAGRHTNLIFSPGTQVVSLIEVCAADDRTVHPRGAVGVIVRSPADINHSYRVRFLDGYETTLRPAELMLLAQYKDGDIADNSQLVDQVNLFERVIYRCVIGSQAYGLAGEASDVDRRGIYLPPAEAYAATKLPERPDYGRANQFLIEARRLALMEGFP